VFKGVSIIGIDTRNCFRSIVK